MILPGPRDILILAGTPGLCEYVGRVTTVGGNKIDGDDGDDRDDRDDGDDEDDGDDGDCVDDSTS